jgi:hypothetical protein
MSQLTPLGNLPYPQPTDVADIPTHIQSLAEAIDGRTVLRFADAATRDAKVTAPVAGMVAWLTTPGKLYYYTGSYWAPVTPGPVYKVNLDGGTTTSTTYVETLTNAAGDPMNVAFTAPPSGSVIVTVGAYIFGTGTVASYMSATIRQGTTVVLATSDDRAAIVNGTERASVSTQFQVNNLTAGSSYTATPGYRSAATTNTANFDTRFVRIDPIT